MSTSVDQRRCAHVGEDGDQCRVTGGLVDPDTGFCFSHDPSREEERRAARERGGMRTALRAKKSKALDPDELGPLETPRDAVRWCRIVGAATATGRLSASAANAALRAISEWRAAHEQAELLEELEDLKSALKRNGRRS